MTLFSRATLILALAAALPRSSAEASSCVNTGINNTCAPGCWSSDNVFDHDNDALLCIPVQAGYYSPADSNERLKCELGFVAPNTQSYECTPCPSGTMATPDHTACVPCLAGTYQDDAGQVLCKQCNPLQYKGQGGNAITNDGYCLLIDNNENSMNSSSSSCIHTRGTCQAGCWNAGILDNGDKLCIPVEPGYYSPAHFNERLKCEKGRVSTHSQSSHCTPCREGTFAAGTSCMPCPSGTYQDAAGGQECYGCNPERYGGLGANDISKDGYCMLVQLKNYKLEWNDRVEKRHLRRGSRAAHLIESTKRS